MPALHGEHATHTTATPRTEDQPAAGSGRPDALHADNPRTRRRAVALFLASTFGLMAMLSLPLAQLLPGPLGSAFGGLERILRPRIATAPSFRPWRTPSEDQAFPPRSAAGAVPGSGGPAQGSGGRNGSGGQVLEPPVTVGRGSPPPALGPSEISPLDIHTIAVLGRMLRPLGRPPFRQLVRHSDHPDATSTLVLLTAQKRLSDLPSTITPAELHWRLADLRKNLPSLREQAMDRRPPGGSPDLAWGHGGPGRPSSATRPGPTPSRSLTTQVPQRSRAAGHGSRSRGDAHRKPPNDKHHHRPH